MALLLPQCAPPESLRQLTVRQRLSLRRLRKPARATTHGAAESNNSTKASADRFRIPGTEPCCALTSPLVMTPRTSVRRSSRLRVRKGRLDDAKTDTDRDAADWINRVLDNNGVVEVDPVTMAEQMHQGKHYQTDSPNTTSHHHSANYVSSADASDIYPPRSPGFPSRVPLAVTLAAGSAVALAAIAFLIQALHREGEETTSTSSDSEGSNLTSSFKGDPVAPGSSSKGSSSPPQWMRGNKEALASTAAAGAAAIQPGNYKSRSNMPSPPSLSKPESQGNKSQSPNKYASVTPFFSSDKSPVSNMPSPPSLSKPGSQGNKSQSPNKYASVAPFFSSDKSPASNMPSPPSVSKPGSQGNKSQSPNKYASVAPFFSSDKSPASNMPSPPSVSKPVSQGNNSQSSNKYASVAPFFSSDKSPASNMPSPPSVSKPGSQGNKSQSPNKYASVAPFFSSDKSPASNMPSPPSVSKPGSQGNNSQSSNKYASVAPFFSSDKSPVSYSRPAPAVSRWGEDKFKSVQPFFADEQSSTKKKKSENGSSSNKPVTPFSADEQQGRSVSLESVPPFSADEQQSSNGPSVKTVTPFFADEQQQKNGSSLENVTPFFADEQPGPRATGLSQSKSRLDLENVKPFFSDEQEERPSRSTSSGQSSSASGASPFWGGESSRDALAASDERSSGVSTRIPEDLLSGPMQSEGKEMLAEMAGKPQGQHKEFMDGTTEERLASNARGAFSFQGEEEGAPAVTRSLSPEEIAILEEIKAEEERRHAKMQALQAAFPALAIGAGAVGALVGVDGAFEMVGVTATASFISYELLWANKRQELLDEISRITDHHKLFRFLQKRKIVKDDC